MLARRSHSVALDTTTYNNYFSSVESCLDPGGWPGTTLNKNLEMQAQNRIHSIDALRGLTVAAMLVVNDAGDWNHVHGSNTPSGQVATWPISFSRFSC